MGLAAPIEIPGKVCLPALLPLSARPFEYAAAVTSPLLTCAGHHARLLASSSCVERCWNGSCWRKARTVTRPCRGGSRRKGREWAGEALRFHVRGGMHQPCFAMRQLRTSLGAAGHSGIAGQPAGLNGRGIAAQPAGLH